MHSPQPAVRRSSWHRLPKHMWVISHQWSKQMPLCSMNLVVSSLHLSDGQRSLYVPEKENVKIWAFLSLFIIKVKIDFRLCSKEPKKPKNRKCSKSYHGKILTLFKLLTNNLQVRSLAEISTRNPLWPLLINDILIFLAHQVNFNGRYVINVNKSTIEGHSHSQEFQHLSWCII